ncbi:MAG: 2-oxoacid:acceptor oxidoreductase family protein [Dehalococcoidia bacterium]|nr:2-oxoacid:acceptor oxidoreductase family protein [Dehalococcoidia bacterium]
MSQIKQALICGYGGQGIVLAGTILGQAAFNDGKWVGGTNSYGAASRGGACRSEVVISGQPIIFPYVIEVDVLIAMYQTAYDKYIGEVRREGGIVVYDDRFVTLDKVDGVRQVPVPATRTALEELKSELVPNVVMLGAVVEITGLVTKDALRSAVAETVAERLRELDLKAVEAGFRLGSGKSA